MFRLLIGKELRELLASRAYWLLLLVAGLLVGHAFMTSVNLYSEMSGGTGGPAALSQGLKPLDGIIVPTLGAYDLSAMLLFPFVIIRLVAEEKRTGALQLMLQSPAPLPAQLAAKVIALLVGWVVAWTPGIIALVLWRMSGGHLNVTEAAAVFAGHFIGGVIAIGIAMAAASLTDGAAAAAVLTLAITLGMWALEFTGAVHGGMAEELAQLTPGGLLHRFERGELAAKVLLAPAVVTAGLIAISGWCLHPGRPRVARIMGSVLILFVTVIIAASCEELRWSRDLSEDRRNSFTMADERVLRTLPGVLRIDINLAPEDPRLEELERETLNKLERTVPHVSIKRQSRSVTGILEGSADHYGEIWYSLQGKRAMSRSVQPEFVLDQIYALAGLPVPNRDAEPGFAGFPHVAKIASIPIIFFIIWPILLGVLYWYSRWERAPSISGKTSSAA